ncbi:MAG: hypothetical protein GY922_03080 [Proteobacteria bacterium]|nr:hypothetical protein [Pseudomonadota bacterium]
MSELIERLRNADGYSRENYTDYIQDLTDEAADRITELENPWISVDDPPTPDRNILLRFDNGEICTGYLCMMRGEYIPDDLAQHLSDVHHWMHLNWNDPPPPEAT